MIDGAGGGSSSVDANQCATMNSRRLPGVPSIIDLGGMTAFCLDESLITTIGTQYRLVGVSRNLKHKNAFGFYNHFTMLREYYYAQAQFYLWGYSKTNAIGPIMEYLQGLGFTISEIKPGFNYDYDNISKVPYGYCPIVYLWEALNNPGSNQRLITCGKPKNLTECEIKEPVLSCYTKGDVSGTLGTGGFAGDIDAGQISNCYSSGNVFGETLAGGFAGIVVGGNIKYCFAEGNVEATDHDAGGFTGYIAGGNISNTYSSGYVNVPTNGGGYVGTQEAGSVLNSYTISKVTGNSNIGGFAGVVEKTASQNSSYWNTTINPTLSACSSSSCAALGKTTAQLKSSADENVFIGWDNNIWCFACDDYPLLKNMPLGAPERTYCNLTSCRCPSGATGTYPNCNCSALVGTKAYDEENNKCVPSCPSGATGTYPNCLCSTLAAPLYDIDNNICATCPVNSTWDSSKNACIFAGDSSCPNGYIGIIFPVFLF